MSDAANGVNNPAGTGKTRAEKAKVRIELVILVLGFVGTTLFSFFNLQNATVKLQQELINVKMQLELNSTAIYKDIASLLADEPNTVAVYLLLEATKKSYENGGSETNKIVASLEEMIKNIKALANSRIKQEMILLFDDNKGIRSASITAVLENLCVYNISDFIQMCKTEIAIVAASESAKKYIGNGCQNILYILHCQDESTFADVKKELGELLDIILEHVEAANGKMDKNRIGFLYFDNLYGLANNQE